MSQTRSGNLSCIIVAICLLGVFSLLSQRQMYVRDEAEWLGRVEVTKGEAWSCVACTFIVGLASQLRQLHHTSSKEALKMFCGYFGFPKEILCRAAFAYWLRGASHLIDGNKTPDVVCQTLRYCKNEKCHLFPREENQLSPSQLREMYGLKGVHTINICDVFPELCNLGRSLYPLVDLDGDLFSTHPTFRGSDWRGRDCDDVRSTVYPGRNTSDVLRDENCNGIYGVDNVTGKSFEELWCFNSSAMGVIALGDSMTAHFGIPENFVTARNLSRDAFSFFNSVIEDEVDWPMLSSITGFLNTSKYKPVRSGPMKSVYSELLKRNRCNHRDYQNLAVNGAGVNDLNRMMNFVARNRTQEVKPALLFLSMLGNDVCDFPLVTDPETYYLKVTEALEKAEDLLPTGSHVLIFPLVDGRLLYESMHSRIHPIGSLNDDVTYDDFYNFLDCVQVSPCRGWMNSNESVRNATWEAAQSLNAQIPRILNESVKKFKHIQVYALDDVVAGVVRAFDGPLWDLVEPVDGFHFSQMGAALLGEYLFNKSVELGLVPPVNPFNEVIKKRFGDQGGH